MTFLIIALCQDVEVVKWSKLGRDVQGMLLLWSCSWVNFSASESSDRPHFSRVISPVRKNTWDEMLYFTILYPQTPTVLTKQYLSFVSYHDCNICGHCVYTHHVYLHPVPKIKNISPNRFLSSFSCFREASKRLGRRELQYSMRQVWQVSRFLIDEIS